MMLAGTPVPPDAMAALAAQVRAADAGDLADRLDRALADDVKILALTIADRSIVLFVLDDPPEGLAELRAVLLNEHEWRQREGLDPFPG